MKEGRFLRAPDGPADMKLLWQKARALDAASLPAWLPLEEVAAFRLVASVSRAGLAREDEVRYRDELRQCQAAGLIVETDSFDPSIQHVFISAPRQEQVWSIGLFHGPSPFDLGPASTAPGAALSRQDVTDVQAVFVADPFLVRVGDGWRLFFEVMNWQAGKGEIGLASSTDGLQWTYERIVLAEPFHLSYPLVFEWQGVWYMVPESYQAGAALLYKAIDFPVSWRCLGALLRGAYLADTTVFHHEGRWWLFTDTSRDMGNDTLRLFHAEDLSGPWQEHPRSPLIVGDRQIARPAGRVVSAAGRLVRFTQSCLPYYGTDVRAFEIEELTTTAYREREHPGNPILKPTGKGWNASGMHHLDAHRLEDGTWLAAVDGWRWG